MRASLTLAILAACSLMFEAQAQNSVPIQGCSGSPQTWNVTADVDQNGKLFYRDGFGNDAAILHVCPGDDVTWAGKQDGDVITISFVKQGAQDSPADDGALTTENQPRIQKHIKQNHARVRYPYNVTLGRGGTQTVDDPLIIIGQ